MTQIWTDAGIRTNFSTAAGANETYIPLQTSIINKIWKPDLYVFNRSALLDPYGTRSTISLKLYSLGIYNNLHKIAIDEEHAQNDSTLVEYKSEVRSRVYCNFDYSIYPMDTHTCTLSLGSRSSSATFVLQKEISASYAKIPSYKAAGFEIASTFFDENINNGSNTIGVKMCLKRDLQSFIMKYYAPAIMVVMVSSVSFMVSLIGYGRIGLLVTLLLTLINLFIHHLVSMYFADKRINIRD